MLWEFTTAEYELKSLKEEEEMAVDGRNRSRDDFFLFFNQYPEQHGLMEFLLVILNLADPLRYSI